MLPRQPQVDAGRGARFEAGAAKRLRMARQILAPCQLVARMGTPRWSAVIWVLWLGLRSVMVSAILRPKGLWRQAEVGMRGVHSEHRHALLLIAAYALRPRACYELAPVAKAGKALGNMSITKMRKCKPASICGRRS